MRQDGGAGVNIKQSEPFTGRSRYFSYPNVADRAKTNIFYCSRLTLPAITSHFLSIFH